MDMRYMWSAMDTQLGETGRVNTDCVFLWIPIWERKGDGEITWIFRSGASLRAAWF